MPSEFHNREPTLPFGNSKSRPWYGMDIFWNRPFRTTFTRTIKLNLLEKTPGFRPFTINIFFILAPVTPAKVDGACV